MSTPDPLPAQQRRFRLVLWPVAVFMALVALLHSPAVDDATSETAAPVALVLSALVGVVSCLVRVRQTRGRRRRTWMLVVAAGSSGAASNLWSVGREDGPVGSPDAIADGFICLALLLSIAALLSFPTVRRRGIDRALLIIDGALITTSVLLVTSVLVYGRLIDDMTGEPTPVTTQLIPVLDVVLVTVALLLMVRSTGADRPSLALISCGFVMYTLADLTFAVQVASGDFRFGGPTDLGWVAGYLLIGLAALYPSTRAEGPSPAPAELSDGRDAALVFAVVLCAGAVQVLAPGDTFGPTQGLLWLTIVAAAGLRQTLLTRDNTALRHNLEQRVRAQTTDLRRMARQTRTLIRSVGDGVYGVDGEGRITFVNPSAARVLGFSADELLGHSAHDRLHAPAPDGTPYPAGQCYITEAIREGRTAHAEADVYLRSDGTTFPVEITASPVVDEDRDQAVGAVVVFRDVTQRREVDRLKNEFVSVVSHELRTPLTSIRGTLGLLAGGALGELEPRAQAVTAAALDSSERLTRLINDILDLERIESGTSDLTLATHEAADVVGASAAEMRTMAEGLGIRLTVGAVSGRVMADRDRVVQTLTNLIGNALKFSERGSEVVLCAEPAGAQVVFSVVDQGRGIPEDKLASIFERFHQVDSSDARQKGGTGLGLAISRGIVERHGGRIWAESTLGEGTTVSFTLPTSAVATAHRAVRVPVVALLGSARASAAWVDALGEEAVDIVHLDPDDSPDDSSLADPAVLPAGRAPAVTALTDPVDDLVATAEGRDRLRCAVRVARGATASSGSVLVLAGDAALGTAIADALAPDGVRVTRVDPHRHVGTVLERDADVLVVDLDSPGALDFLDRHPDNSGPHPPALVTVHRTTALAGAALDALGRDVLTLLSGSLTRQNGDPR